MTAPGITPLHIADGAETFAHVRGLFAGRLRALVTVITILIIGAALGLVAPWGFGHIVDEAVTGDRSVEGVLRLGAVMIVAAVASASFMGWGVALTGQLFETVLARLREQLVHAALRLPQSRVEAAGSGDLVSRTTDDVQAVSEAIVRGVPAVSQSLFTVLLTAVGFAFLDWRFLAVVIVIIPVYVFGVRMYLRTAPPVYRHERAAMARRAHHLLGTIQGLSTVQAFGLGGVQSGRIASGSWGVVRWSMRARIVQNRFGLRINVAEYLGMSTILVVGLLLVRADLTTVGATTAAMLLFLRLFGPIGQLLLVIDDVQSGAASLTRIVGVIRTAEEETGPEPHGTAVSHGAGVELAVDDVSYSYGEAENRVLHSVSVRVEPGESVAIVGSSGAGKSTLAYLMTGLFAPGDGVVRLGGVPVAEVPERDAPVLLTQDVHVFAGPLVDDLRMVAADADRERVAAALREVHAWRWVSRLPDGLDTDVGAGGHRLTPMQAQQVALARLILLDPGVVVLDEATADADSADADLLERAAAAALRGRTSVVIAHRLSQAEQADRVLVMHDGRVVEQGAHRELVVAGGRYAELWEAWSRHRER